MKSNRICFKYFISFTLIVVNFNALLVGQTEDSRQRVIPKSPEAATFDKFINFPAVSGTGIPDIQIPLYTLQYKGFSFPISISYHPSGIKVDDIATPVGLNWVLNANSFFSRNILGLADEYGWFTFDTTAALSCISDNVKPFYDGVYDAAPDVFSYVLPGHSGKFFFKADSSIIKSSADPIRIDDDFNFYYNNSTCLNFTAYDEYGNKYSFLPLGTTAIEVYDNKGGVTSSLDHLNGSGIVEWKLEKITLPTGYEILFTYEPYNYGAFWDDKTSSYYGMLEERLHCSVPTEFYGGFSSIEVNYQTYLLKTIKTEEQKVLFDYDTDPTLSIMKKKLKQISVIDSVSGTNDTTQIIKFHYGKYSGDPRLKLLEVEFLGDNSFNTSKSLKYTCTYKDATLPTIGNYAQDLFGYYNNNTQSHMIPVNSSNLPYFSLIPANREVSTNLIANGVLSEITFPTGGKVKYTFEANTINGKYAPGLRVKTIEYLNTDSSVAEKKQYEYSGLSGITHDSLDFYNYYEYNEVNSGSPPRFRGERRWTASPIPYLRNNFEKNSGFYYEQVTTKTTSGAVVKDSKVDRYSGYTDVFSITPIINERNLFDQNGYRVKTEVFQYSGTTQNYLGWTPFTSYLWTGTDYCNGTTWYCATLYAFLPLSAFNYNVNIFSLSKKTIKSFVNNESDSVLTETDFEYNSFHLPRKISTSTSDGNIINEYFHYADDYNVSDAWLIQMKDQNKHMIGNPIDHRTYIKKGANEYVTGGKSSTYNDYGQVLNEYYWKGSIMADQSVWNPGVSPSVAFPISDIITYEYEPSNKNLINILLPSKNTSYIWGFNNLYPIASAENALSSQISFTGFEDINYGGWTYQSGSRSTSYSRTGRYSCLNAIMQKTVSVNSIISLWVKSGGGTPSISGYTPKVYATTDGWTYYEWNVPAGSFTVYGTNCYIDDLRLYPVGAMMTTYTFDPLIGMTSATDPNGIITRYEYDSFGRLKNVRNNDGNITARNYYHYYNDTSSDTPYLNTSPTSMSFGSSASSSSLTITSNSSWSITDNATWLSVNTTSGTGNATVTVSVTANTSAARYATITITYTGGLTKTVSVSQAAGLTLTISPQTINFPSFAPPEMVTVTSNTSWTVTKSDSWITLSATSGTGNGEVGIGVTELLSGDRTGTVTFKTTDNTITRIVNVYQDSGLQQ